MVAGAARTVSFYAPTRRDGRPPLVIAFHGTSGSSEDWISGNDPSGIESLANDHGFVVAAPQSRLLAQPDWDHEYDGGDKYWETAAPRGSDPNANPDLLFVSAIIASAQATFGADPKRTYALGFSNGGFFAILTALALRDRIAAFAEVGSGLVTCATTRSCSARSTATECTALLRGATCSCSGAEKPITIPTSGRLVPGLLAHNNRDDVVSPVYTCALYQRMKTLGYDVEVMIGDAEGHGHPEGFLPRAWTFLAARRLP
jgi:poly(3-hydroxybutyrate) depolymerase